ncbi:MAG: helicase HerA-like domain-containing protein, partial [Asticcacaulis sp.]
MSVSGETQGLLVGFSDKPDVLLWNRANRHGLVAGATGTGKTITLQVLAQAFSEAGVPVFAADIKGDLSGVSIPGTPNEKLLKRAETVGIALEPAGAPCIFWDLFGQSGHPIRTTVSEMGPLLLSRLFELNDVQEGVLSIAFHVADKEGLLLLDLDDLRALLNYVGENAAEISRTYGQVSQASIGAIQRQILQLETQGGDQFFGEPALRLEDLLRTDIQGRGYINVLSADKLIANPRLYSTFLLWLLSELFEQLPEIGDPEKPRVVFFFDEAHLLFREAPKALLEKVEQVVRLIRSKGVGIYFVTQNPADIPDAVLAQLGNRVQHALRAYTPSEQKGLKAAADSFRPNPDFDTAEKIQTLGVGEAVVSLLDAKGIPSMAAHCLIRPPASRLGPVTPEERKAQMATSPVGALYNASVNRDSAYEILTRRAEAAVDAAEAEDAVKPAPKSRSRAEPAPARSQRQGAFEALAVSLL